MRQGAATSDDAKELADAELSDAAQEFVTACLECRARVREEVRCSAHHSFLLDSLHCGTALSTDVFVASLTPSSPLSLLFLPFSLSFFLSYFIIKISHSIRMCLLRPIRHHSAALVL
jgi:hypothetical protein